MNINKLEGHIDFGTFWVVGIFKGNQKHIAILLAPKNHKTDKHFNLQLGEKSHWFGSLDNMLKVCTELGYTNTFKNMLVKYKYNNLIKKQ